MLPNVRSMVPGWRTSARVAHRAQRLRVLGGVGAFPLGDFAAKLLEKHPALLRRELRERLGMRLLDRFRRGRFQHVPIARQRLLVLGRLDGPRVVRARLTLVAGLEAIEDAHLCGLLW